MQPGTSDAPRAPLWRTVVIIAVAAGAGAIAGGAIGLGLSGRQTSDEGDDSYAVASSAIPAAPGSALSPEAVYRQASPGVVVITVTQVESIPATPFTPPGREMMSALGSGFVVDSQGDIVTNDHVVRGARNIRVGFGEGATYPATIVGTDRSSDLAVVRVKAPPAVLHPLAFDDDSSSVRVGDPAYAIGNPFGLDRTMTSGIVSATGRDIRAPNNLTIPNAIQTDAPINHGNSGGPLLDGRARVIGVNAQIEAGTINANVGIGFAIPSDTARTVVSQLVATGHARHPWLGVEIETIDPSVAAVVRGLPAHGVMVTRVVRGSPAEKAGLIPSRRQVTVGGASAFVGGDAIVGVDGKPVTTSAALSDLVAQRKAGDRISLDVVRRGRARTVEVTLGNAPA